MLTVGACIARLAWARGPAPRIMTVPAIHASSHERHLGSCCHSAQMTRSSTHKDAAMASWVPGVQVHEQYLEQQSEGPDWYKVYKAAEGCSISLEGVIQPEDSGCTCCYIKSLATGTGAALILSTGRLLCTW